MSDTAGELIRDALTELTVQAQEQTVPAVDLNTGIRYLNRMMASLDARGVKLGYTIVSNPSDVLTVPDGAVEGMMFQLALRLANGFQVPVGQELIDNAREGKETLYHIGITLDKQNFPSSLPLGSGNEQTSEAYANQHFFPGCCEDQDECCDSSSNDGDSGFGGC